AWPCFLNSLVRRQVFGCLYFSWPAAPRAFPSFPTRRSSDLPRRLLDDGERRRSGPVIERGRRVGSRAGARARRPRVLRGPSRRVDRKSTRLNSSHVKSSYAVFCLKKKSH